jgi:hypothetical protein
MWAKWLALEEHAIDQELLQLIEESHPVGFSRISSLIEESHVSEAQKKVQPGIEGKWFHFFFKKFNFYFRR